MEFLTISDHMEQICDEKERRYKFLTVVTCYSTTVIDLSTAFVYVNS